MGKLTPDQYADKLINRLSGATADIRLGVDNVTEAPTLKAAAKKDKMLQNLTAAVQSGKWEAGLKGVSLEDWKDKMINKGIARIPAGVQAAKSKIVDFAAKLIPFQDNLQGKVKGMPDLTLGDNVQRAVAWIEGMSKFKK